MKRRTFLACLSTIITVVVGAQYAARPSTAGAASLPRDLGGIAHDVAAGVGQVAQVSSTGAKGSVIVLQEFHTSRPGRVQSAIMLYRLYKRYGVRTIGLEGAFQSAQPLDGSWFQRAGGPNVASAREDIAVQMLSDGEINQAEFMMLLYPEITVHGTERADEHPQLNVKGNPEMVYLLGIAEKSASGQALRHVEDLLQRKKEDEAIDYLLNADPWVKSQYEALKDDANISLETVVQRIDAIEAKAAALGVSIEPNTKAEMHKLREFYELRAKASGTMVKRIASVATAKPNQTIAMIIGAAHTPEVSEALKREGLSFAVLSPNDLNSAAASLTNDQFDRKQAGKWAWDEAGTLGRILNGESNSPPITQTATGKSYANMSLAGLLIAQAARANKPLPEALDKEFSTLEGLRIDKTSFAKDGNDVIFRAWLQNVKGREVEVWARVGATNTPDEMKEVEQKLLAAEQRINAATQKRGAPSLNAGGGGKKGGGGTATRSAADDNPERKRSGREIVPLGPTALAVFGNSRQDVGSMPRISG